MKLIIDKEIQSIIPEQQQIAPTDEKKTTSRGEAVERGYKPHDAWRNALRESLAASKSPHIRIVAWKDHGIILDGIEQFLICRELGIKIRDEWVEWVELPDRAAAMRERWIRNVTTIRHLPEAARAEQVYRRWDEVFRSARTAKAKQHKGGRGKKVPAGEKVDQLQEMAEMARVSRGYMEAVQRFLRAYDNPKTKMPRLDLKERLRRLRNGTMPIRNALDDVIGFDERVGRKALNKARNHKPVDWTKPENKGVRTKWTGETNVVINGDCLNILEQVPCEAIDRFVFSPPYYLCDASGDFHINYGDEFEPFRGGWDQYCNWTLRYLVEMWRILPKGGYIVINVDNPREPSFIEVRDPRSGEVVEKRPNPEAGKFYYHTDMLRAILRDIDLFMQPSILSMFLESKMLNPLRRGTWDIHPLDMPRDQLFDQLARDEGGLGVGPTPFDRGEFIWSKHQIVAKRDATGSKNAPRRRPNHEYVLFWQKGDVREQQASTMRSEDKNKWTISTWDEDEEVDAFETELFSFWSIPAAPDTSKELRHKAPFPPKLARRMIEFGGSVGDVVCDPFCGRGTTLAMAALRGREYVGIDIVPQSAARSHREAVKAYKQFQAEQKTVSS